jgi:hypothetical protein
MNAVAAAIWARARELILRPQPTWATISSEVHDAQQLVVGWVLPLAAVPAVARLIGGLAFGKLRFPRLLSQVIGSYVLTVLVILAVAWLAAWLAPRFGGQNRYERGLAWTAYAATPGLLAGVFLLIPGLSFLQAVGGLYGVYIAYLGLPAMMRSRPEQSVLYLLAVVAITVAAMFVLSPVVNLLVR